MGEFPGAEMVDKLGAARGSTVREIASAVFLEKLPTSGLERCTSAEFQVFDASDLKARIRCCVDS